MATVLRERVEKLACEFSIDENYFAWQAFGRSYSDGGSGPLPPYLERAHFDTIRDRADRVEVLNRSFTEYLKSRPAQSLDRYVLLDAQDWMSDLQLNDLWREITRTARPGARVIFRTAAEPSLLPGRVDDEVLEQWHYEAERFARADAPRPLRHLWRLPSLRARGGDMTLVSSTELMNRTYRHQRHIYDFTRKYYPARPRPADRDLAPRARRRRPRDRLRHRPQSRRRRVPLSGRAPVRHRRLDGNADLGLPEHRPCRPRVADARSLTPTPPAFDPQPLFGIARFDRVFVSYSLSMIPEWRGRDRPRALHPRSRRRTAHRRLRRPERLPGVFRTLLRRWLALFHVTPRDDLEPALRARAHAPGHC